MPSRIVAIIPARSGSKSVVDKNIRPMAGLPLLAWSIKHARDCPEIDRVIVSTDSEVYADLARKHGADVPFLRPAEFAQDHSTDIEVFRHALQWLAENEHDSPEIVVHLRPTYPYRNVGDISAMIRLLESQPEADAVRSVVEAPETPYKMWRMGEDNYLTPLLTDVAGEPYNMPRQVLPTVYLQNAAIDVVRSRVISEQNSMTGQRILGYPIAHNYDIDTELHFALTAEALSVKECLQPVAEGEKPKSFCFDIDGVVAQIVPDLDYAKAKPNEPIIRALNRLYALGHRITLFTARGTLTGIDWRKQTETQLNAWGVNYHELAFGKPAADYYIDDKMLSLVSLLAIS